MGGYNAGNEMPHAYLDTFLGYKIKLQVRLSYFIYEDKDQNDCRYTIHVHCTRIEDCLLCSPQSEA